LSVKSKLIAKKTWFWKLREDQKLKTKRKCYNAIIDA